jgi:2-hydroxychromene-2-carboxylate isomerase
LVTGRERAGLLGGTFLVVRRAGATLLRRGFDTDGGLLFLAVQTDPRPGTSRSKSTWRSATPCTPSRTMSGARCSPSYLARAQDASSRNHCSRLHNVPPLHVTHFSDPGCPWAWSASPALAVLQWRYGDQITWRHVMIGLTETGSVYAERGYTPAGQARGYRNFRDRGMPFATEPREAVHGTWPMCRVVVATRRLFPEREWAVFRALQFAQFTGTAFLEDDAALRAAIAWVPGIDADAIIAATKDADNERAFEADRDESRTAEGGPTEFQGKSAKTDGRVRFTAPSLRITSGDTTLEAGGFQPVQAYDVIIANLDPSLARRAPGEDAGEIVREFPDGLTTAEVALIRTGDNYTPDLDAAEDALITAVGDGAARRLAFGHDALWVPAESPAVALAQAA